MADEEAPVVEAPAAPAAMTLLDALQGVLKKALAHDGVVRGLRECVKYLDRKQANLCILSSSVDEAGYVRLVEALCSEHKIPLVKVSDSKQLGLWAGLCKLDSEGHPKKNVKCGCAVITDWGTLSDEREFLMANVNA